MTSIEDIETEVESLHEFFVDWYVGNRDRTEFRIVEDSLAPDFLMISPEGDRIPRDAVCDALRDRFDQYEPGAFEIEIHDVRRIADLGEHQLVNYEEWQWLNDDWVGRLSVALLNVNSSASGGIQWVYKQDTMLADQSKPA